MTLVVSEGTLLRSYPYSESSQILKVLTPGRGIVSLVARGTMKRAAAGDAPVQSFEEALFTYAPKPGRDLYALRDVQPRGAPYRLAGDLSRLTGASLVAELLLAHHLEDGDEELYRWVRRVVERLCSVPDAEVLGWSLSGGWRTLAFLGFLPEFTRCIRCGRGRGGEGDGGVDRLDIAEGGLVCPRCSGTALHLPRVGPGARRELAALVEGTPPLIRRGERAHLSLLEAFAVEHLGPSRKLRSFAALRSVIGTDRGTRRGDGPAQRAGGTSESDAAGAPAEAAARRSIPTKRVPREDPGTGSDPRAH